MRNAPVPCANARFFKAHGLGNDYLVFDAGEDWRMTPAAVQAVCERWEGVGADGVVLQLPPAAGVRRLRMFNPDGSEFERSGNGLRIFAAFLASSGEVAREPFPVEVGGERVVMRVHGRSLEGVYDVSVDMGRASLDPAAVGLDARGLDAKGRIHLPDGAVPVHTVAVGNPHCVVFQEDLSDRALEALGPTLATHPSFASGTNVQLAWPVSARTLRIRIWERGVGPTRASGTSSCAAAAASVSKGLLEPGAIEVLMDGGRLEVHVSPELDITLRGPVTEVCTGALSEGFLASLDGR